MSRRIFFILAVVLSLSTCSLTTEEVRDEIIYCDIKHTEIVLAQTIAEAGWEYDSHNAARRNNLFGMKGGVKSKNNKHGYKVYDDWRESVCAYKEWQDRRYNGGDYYEFLKRSGYSTNPEYISFVKSIVNSLKRKGII